MLLAFTSEYNLRDIFNKHSIKSLLDYGSGGSKWEADGFDEITNESAKD